MLAKDKTPILAGVIPVFEIFMTKWETLAEKRQWLKPFIDEGLRWANKYYIRLDKTTAYVVAMCKSSFANCSQ
jgi:RNA binding exosome subunit